MTDGVDGSGDRQVAVVLGTRPEIIKLAPVINECENRGVDCLLIHTGQHYSDDLDRVFFDQLALPEPDYNLEVGSLSHGEQTGQMLAGIERILEDESPDAVVVQGDTNSTLAGALAATKLHIDVGHVEAGLRSFDREMPEEVNRLAADHISDYLFAPTEETRRYLERESVGGEVFVTGNTVVDTLYEYRDTVREKSTVLEDHGLSAGDFYLLTAHRAENVDDEESFERLLTGVARFAERTDRPVIYPIHPRASARVEEFGLEIPEPIRTIEPLEFLDFLCLESEAALTFTDSGGVQEETCILGTPCVTLRYSTERPETVHAGANCLAGLDPDDIVEAAETMIEKDGDWTVPFGDGNASKRILDVLVAADGADAEKMEALT
ncbi:non-hydrolyzing UDP-N-acetylglucosamine 2-epimerase [Halopelagius longus]|uniref:UDP-N-acetylglucosamine 2-epimerase (Non-hydrolysing) n=1 Tax=Halopelagius longus TaxID=1236180 RepID=A0A1H1GF58_9EURY|nr:UDP-N-acetylglucosamine 2-epimerase (non-hydrolyzing) [Halopelagius longus]RDI69623.1 UDP-N-acetylglucosamine 2-epimerase (non-hydrolyzing) [Halopelagius longus]SDR11922.1 UDP-N-acetylglucosamine 2-epimerase (non-hydrolysing) [Halopelagius longus]